MVLTLESLIKHQDSFNFSFFGISGCGTELDYSDTEWFALYMNRDHSVIFEIAPKYCISGASVVAQMVKKPPAILETWVQTPSTILA